MADKRPVAMQALTGRWYSGDDVVLRTQTSKQQLISGQKHREQGTAVAGRGPLDAFIQGIFDRTAKRLATETLEHGTAAIKRQRQGLRRLRELLQPIGFRFWLHRPMARRVLYEAMRFRQVGRGPVETGRIEKPQFLQKDIHRPAIANNVMGCDYQRMMVFANIWQQSEADERPVYQIEGSRRLAFNEIRETRIERLRLAVRADREGQRCDRCDCKARARRREADAQRLVPLQQIARGFAQRLPIELAVQIKRDRFIEGARSRIAELGAEPNFHLALGELTMTLLGSLRRPAQQARLRHLCGSRLERLDDFRKIAIIMSGRQETGEAFHDMNAVFAQQVVEERREMQFGRKFE